MTPRVDQEACLLVSGHALCPIRSELNYTSLREQPREASTDQSGHGGNGCNPHDEGNDVPSAQTREPTGASTERQRSAQPRTHPPGAEHTPCKGVDRRRVVHEQPRMPTVKYSIDIRAVN